MKKSGEAVSDHAVEMQPKLEEQQS